MGIRYNGIGPLRLCHCPDLARSGTLYRLSTPKPYTWGLPGVYLTTSRLMIILSTVI